MTMEMIVPKGWVAIDLEHFEALLKDLNFTRNAFSNGEYYVVNGEDVLIHMTDGRCYASNKFFKAA